MLSNLEKGYAVHVDPNINPVHQTLVRQMNWLDRNMETLLQQPPAATVRFVSNNKNATQENETHVKDFIDATSKPISHEALYNETKASTPSINHQTTSSSFVHSGPSSSKPLINLPSSSKPLAQLQASVSKSTVNSQPTNASKPTVNSEPTSSESTSTTRKFSHAETKAAEKKRKYQLGQLQSRFCDSFKTSR